MDQFKSVSGSMLAWGNPWDESGMDVDSWCHSGDDCLPIVAHCHGQSRFTAGNDGSSTVEGPCGAWGILRCPLLPS